MTHWALNYLHKPWESGASGPQAYDCYGLIRAVYRDRLQIELPVVDVDSSKALAARHAMQDYHSYGDWCIVAAGQPYQEFDVVQMSHGKHPHHVGLWIPVAGGRVLHSVEGSGVIAQPLDSLKMHAWRILRVYRRAAQ